MKLNTSAGEPPLPSSNQPLKADGNISVTVPANPKIWVQHSIVAHGDAWICQLCGRRGQAIPKVEAVLKSLTQPIVLFHLHHSQNIYLPAIGKTPMPVVRFIVPCTPS